MIIGKNIKHLRELRNMTQHALASELGISQKQLSRIEKNDVSPTIEMVTRIGEALEVSVQEILKFNTSYIFNNISHNQTGEYVNYNNTAVKQLEQLYQNLLDEKERTIQLLLKDVQ